MGTKFYCSTCKKPDRIASYRATFKFHASDGTSSLVFITFNDDTETLFKMTAAQITSMKTTENMETFGKIQKLLSTKPFFIKLSPSSDLSWNGALQWELKGVDLEADVEENNAGSTANVQHSSPAKENANADEGSSSVANSDVISERGNRNDIVVKGAQSATTYNEKRPLVEVEATGPTNKKIHGIVITDKVSSPRTTQIIPRPAKPNEGVSASTTNDSTLAESNKGKGGVDAPVHPQI